MTLLELQDFAAEFHVTKVTVDLQDTAFHGSYAFVYSQHSPDVPHYHFQVTPVVSDHFETMWREVERRLQPIGLQPVKGRGWE